MEREGRAGEGKRNLSGRREHRDSRPLPATNHKLPHSDEKRAPVWLPASHTSSSSTTTTTTTASTSYLHSLSSTSSSSFSLDCLSKLLQ
ncbi:hypothetical protein E2C01_102341 [Portunus trituberculatus]|uniref:Uncharacterized protein n=1 Tax=Portunus trituberculatus TaxID=210409 RepID=A0A5B7KI77_PORTR|nr:hypothetical protein [Portunus trituberculatus]